MALQCQIWLFVPIHLILLNKHNFDSQQVDHVLWHTGHTHNSFPGGSLHSVSIFHYLHKQPVQNSCQLCWMRWQSKKVSNTTSTTTTFVLHEMAIKPSLADQFPCGRCDLNVDWSQLAVCCDECDHWYHKTCISMTSSEYNDVSDESWICAKCIFYVFWASTSNSICSEFCTVCPAEGNYG